jgi:hypothetical protein
MAKKYYRYSGPSNWMGLSGNAILALYNAPGSGKKFVVHSVEIYNKNQLGYNSTVDSAAQTPSRICVAYVTALAGGTNITPSSMVSSATFPSTIQIKRCAQYTPTLVNWNGSVTYTDATVASGDVTFTPGSAPSWIANEHRDAGRYFVASGTNAGTYRIVANTTTDMTLDRGLITAASTTGTVSEVKIVSSHAVLKTSVPSNTAPPVNASGYINQNFYGSTGSVFCRGKGSAQQDIYVRAGEKLAIFANTVNSSMPLFVEATFIVEGTPNRTYHTSFFSYYDAEGEAMLSIDNNTGSGEVIRLVQLAVSEVGTLDTPYFQLVPIGSIDPTAFSDASSQLTPFPVVTANGALGAAGKLFTNVPVLPAGVPSSYIAEGAPAAATPRGFNYFNSKDFIGPVYMTFFPEGAAYKIPNTAFYTAGAPGTFGTHISQEFSKIKGFGGAPITIREGEAVGIVSGAETATGTVAMGISGFGAYEFGITFTVEDTVTPTITITGLKAGSEVRAYTGTDPATATAVAGIESSIGTSYSFIHDNAGQNGYIMIFALGYQAIQLDITYAAAVIDIPVQQIVDRNYANA